MFAWMPMARSSAQSALLSDEILALSPWAYWKLDETGTPANYADSSGNGRSLSNIVSVTNGQAAIAGDGTSVDVNGAPSLISSTSSQYGKETDAAFDGTGKPWTFLSHYRPDTVASGACVMHAGAWSVNFSQGIAVIVLGTGGIRLHVRAGAGWIYLDAVPGTIVAGNTYQIACRYNPSVGMAMLVNGSVVASNTVTTADVHIRPTSSGSGNRLMLGALNDNTPSNHCDGRLQHCAMFTSALSDAQILHLAQVAGLA